MRRMREWERSPHSLPPFPYTQHCAERENSYTHAYIVCTCSNAKVISPVTCRSSVKYLMNPRPVEAFLSTPGGERVGPSTRFFCTISLPPLPPASPWRFRPSIKSHSKRSCCKSIENGKKYNKKKGCEITEVHERLRPKKHIKDAPRRRENRMESVDRPRNSRVERDSPLLSVIVRAELSPFFRKWKMSGRSRQMPRDILFYVTFN